MFYAVWTPFLFLMGYDDPRRPAADHLHGQCVGAALGAAALQVWAAAANSTKSLDRKTVAGAIRGQTIKGTIFGDLAFEANGQAKHKHTIFKVTDGKTSKTEVMK